MSAAEPSLLGGTLGCKVLRRFEHEFGRIEFARFESRSHARSLDGVKSPDVHLVGSHALFAELAKVTALGRAERLDSLGLVRIFCFTKPVYRVGKTLELTFFLAGGRLTTDAHQKQKRPANAPGVFLFLRTGCSDLKENHSVGLGPHLHSLADIGSHQSEEQSEGGEEDIHEARHDLHRLRIEQSKSCW